VSRLFIDERACSGNQIEELSTLRLLPVLCDVSHRLVPEARVEGRPPCTSVHLIRPHTLRRYAEPLTSPEFLVLAEKAGVTGGPNVIRHTVRTWLAERRVPDSEADAFMGHKGEGSATGKRYIHEHRERTPSRRYTTR
jgi:integrase